MGQYHYNCYGLRISSSFPCPELIEVEAGDTPDVEIIVGTTPESLANASRKGARFEIASGELLLQVDGIARYWVKGGTKIVVQQFDGGDPKARRLYLYGTALGAALLQRSCVPLHATTVTRDGVTVSFAGSCGAGKSTTAHTLIKRGWKLVCDDVTVLKEANEELLAEPGFPSIKLWSDVLEGSQTDLSTLPRIREEIDKFRWDAKKAFHAKPAAINAIVVLEPWNESKIDISPIKGVEKFRTLTRETYRRQMISGMVEQQRIFDIWSKAVGQIPFWKIKRPKAPFNPEPLADSIQQLFE